MPMAKPQKKQKQNQKKNMGMGVSTGVLKAFTSKLPSMENWKKT